MPAKMARSAPRPPFAVAEGLAAVRSSLLSCRKAGEARIFTPVREPSRGSHLDRNVQSSKMIHAALLLLILEAVHTDLVFTISLKRSTQTFSYPQARRPITPSLASRADILLQHNIGRIGQSRRFALALGRWRFSASANRPG